jgi:hypothetical protein
MFYMLKVIGKDNIIRFETEFDRKRKIDVEKLKQEYKEKYKDCIVEVE